MTRLNLGAHIGNSDVTIMPAEHAEERIARVVSEQRAKLLADIKATVLFCVVLAGTIAIGAFCAYTIFFDATANLEQRKWAETVLTALASGGFSFLVGRAIGGAP